MSPRDRRPVRPRSKTPIMTITNRHVDSAPDLTDLPKHTYVSYWMNALHEQLIFIRRGSSRSAELYMGDAGWERLEVRQRSQEELRGMVQTALEANKVKPTPARLERYAKMINPLVDGVILGEGETRWLELCWVTSSETADFMWEKEQAEPTGLSE